MFWSPKKSLASLAMSWLGRRLIVDPVTIDAPADFFYEPGDRDLPPRTEMQRPDTQRERIRVDAIRRALLERVALLSSAGALCVCVAAMLVAGTVSGVGQAISGPREMSGAEQMRCAHLAGIPEQRRTAAQRREFARLCK